jgi:site-specific recombinase XerC
VAQPSIVGSTEDPTSLARLIEDFLADLRQANQSPHTVRAYASDLAQFAAFQSGVANVVTAET